MALIATLLLVLAFVHDFLFGWRGQKIHGYYRTNTCLRPKGMAGHGSCTSKKALQRCRFGRPPAWLKRATSTVERLEPGRLRNVSGLPRICLLVFLLAALTSVPHKASSQHIDGQIISPVVFVGDEQLREFVGFFLGAYAKMRGFSPEDTLQAEGNLIFLSAPKIASDGGLNYEALGQIGEALPDALKEATNIPDQPCMVQRFSLASNRYLTIGLHNETFDWDPNSGVNCFLVSVLVTLDLPIRALDKIPTELLVLRTLWAQ